MEALAGVRRIRLGRPAPSSSLFDLELDDFVVSMERTDCLDYLRPFRTRTFGSRPEMTNLVGWMEGHAPETRVALSAYSMGEVPDHAQRLVRELMKHMAADLLQRGLAHVREVGSDEYLPAIECDVWASDGRAGRTFRAPDRMTVLEVIDSMV